MMLIWACFTVVGLYILVLISTLLLYDKNLISDHLLYFMPTIGQHFFSVYLENIINVYYTFNIISLSHFCT